MGPAARLAPQAPLPAIEPLSTTHTNLLRCPLLAITPDVLSLLNELGMAADAELPALRISEILKHWCALDDAGLAGHGDVSIEGSSQGS